MNNLQRKKRWLDQRCKIEATLSRCLLLFSFYA